MTSRERVMAVIEGRKPDRIPLYGWVKANLEEPITAAFGSVADFEDRYEFDLAHLFGGAVPHWDELKEWKAEHGRPIEPPEYLDIPLRDVNDDGMYDNLREQIRHHKEARGRFVYVQTPGIFECLNRPFGIENHLCHLLLFEKELHAVYRRQAEWNRRFAMNCLDLGVDMIHVSDDWGAQRGLLFSPDVWHKMIAPNHKITCDAVKARGAYLSLHSDGNVTPVLDGIVKLGYDVVHPYQESAGMDYGLYLRDYRDAFAILGGLDVQTTIGFGQPDRLVAEIERILRMFADRGILYCTTHFVQAHCSIDELRLAFDTAYRLCREVV
mgnify:CR=1 FL=1